MSEQEEEWLYGEGPTVVSLVVPAAVEVKAESPAPPEAPAGAEGEEEAPIALRPPEDLLQEGLVTEGLEGEGAAPGRKRAHDDEDGPEAGGATPKSTDDPPGSNEVMTEMTDGGRKRNAQL